MKNPYNHAFPPPAFLTMNSCALDISDQSIKYGELVNTKEGLVLGRYGQESIPAGIIVSGKIQNDFGLVEVLKKLKARENLNFIRVALPEEQMYLFTLSLPKMEHSEIYDAITLQLEEHIPIKGDDAIFAYNIISENNNNILVEVSAVGLSTVNAYLDVFQKAALVPLSFELEAQAITRAVVGYGDQTTCMIVDFGRARTGVSIASAGKVFFTTTVEFGGDSLTDRIAEGLQIPQAEAEDLKKSYGVNSKNKNTKIFEAMQTGLAQLKDELNKHILYWQNHNISGASHDKIDRIILCGGDANLQGLNSYLESQLKIRVTSANSWVNISDFSKSVPSMPFEQSLLYSTVIGLALGDHTRNFSRIVNVLPQENKDKIKRSYYLRFITVSMFAIGLLFLFGTVLLLPSYITSVSKEQESENALESFNKVNKDLDLDSMSRTIVDINSKLSLLSVENTHPDIVEKVFNKILSYKPAGITISTFSYRQKDAENLILEIHGTAIDRQTLSLFKESLLKDPDFKGVEIPISDFLKKNNLSFNLSILLK